MSRDDLESQIHKIGEAAQVESLAVSCFDYANGTAFSMHGEKPFHAASTFKAAILLALLKAAESGRLRLDDHLQVRNRFRSVLLGEPYRIARDRDGDALTHGHVGRSMPLLQLAEVMITRSSNLATNLLLDFLTLEFVHSVLRECDVEGVAVRRGVEDLAAYEASINNEATADGLRRLFQCFLEDRCLNEHHRQLALKILHAQEFNRMLPARLPKAVRVAHKTGEISTHCHDVGIIFPPERKPYVLAVLTQTAPDAEQRQKTVAEISAAIYHALVPHHHREYRHD